MNLFLSFFFFFNITFLIARLSDRVHRVIHLCSARLFPYDPLCLALGAFPSRVQWVVPGTPSLLCHQTTSSYLEVSPQTGRRWVSQTLDLKEQIIRGPKIIPDLKEIIFLSFRWCLAVQCEQKWMEAFQTQSHREPQVTISRYCEQLAVRWQFFLS